MFSLVSVILFGGGGSGGAEVGGILSGPVWVGRVWGKWVG